MLAFTQLGSGCLVNNDNKILRDKKCFIYSEISFYNISILLLRIHSKT